MKNQRFTESDILKLQQKGLKITDHIIDQKLKKAFGLPKEKKYSGKEKNHIEFVLIALKLNYKKEFKFHDTRKFRFDYCLPEQKIAIEYEGIFGGTGDKNGHTGVTHYKKDVVKYNLATLCGWRILRYTADNYMNVASDIEKLLTSELPIC